MFLLGGLFDGREVDGDDIFVRFGFGWMVV